MERGYAVIFPEELRYLKGNQQALDKVKAAWNKSDNPDSGDVWGDFLVDLDGCKVHFTIDRTLSGNYRHGEFAGRRMYFVRGVVVSMTKKAQFALQQRLKKVQVEMNLKITEDLAKLPSNPLLNKPTVECGIVRGVKF